MANSQYAPFLDCPSVVKEFLDYIQTIRGRSAKTVDGYYIDIRTFLRYLKLYQDKSNTVNKELLMETDISDIPTKTITGVTLSIIYSYLGFAKNELDNKQSALARKVSVIRQLYSYLCDNANYMDNNPAKNLDTPTPKKSLPKHLSIEQSLKLLEVTDTPNDMRTYCMVTLFLNCGMRLSELVGINIRHINFDDATITILGKGNKERLAYLNKACFSTINKYLEDSKDIKRIDGALFVSKKGTRLTPRRVEQIIDIAFKKAGIDSTVFSPHKLRHTAATLMYQYGGTDIRVLKEILGHTSLAVTEIYTHTSQEQIRVASESSPFSNVISKSQTKKPTKNAEQ